MEFPSLLLYMLFVQANALGGLGTLHVESVISLPFPML